MKILLIGNYLSDAQQSMQRYAALLQAGLADAGHDVRVIRPAEEAGKLAPRQAAKWFGYIDKLALFPRALRGALDWADLVHVCDHSNAFYMRYLQDRPHLVTCHDLLAVRSARGEMQDQPTRWSGRQLQRMILDGLRLARNIVCVSEATRADVLRCVAGGQARVSVIYNGLNYPYEPMDDMEATGRLSKAGIDPNQGFILHVGGNQWYKNRLGVLRIFAHLRRRLSSRSPALVMAGKPWTDEMRNLVQTEKLSGSAIELVDITEMDLRALYTRAKALLFPSLEEGFGWPIAEAHSCGCPVVTSNRAPMTEVGGDAAFYVDPRDEERAALALAGVIARSADREANLRNASRFRPGDMIDAYAALYRQVLNGAADLAPGAPPREETDRPARRLAS